VISAIPVRRLRAERKPLVSVSSIEFTFLEAGRGGGQGPSGLSHEAVERPSLRRRTAKGRRL
jgi:hypothetical protein